VLALQESVWGAGVEMDYHIGNTAVWPDIGGWGWSWYIHYGDKASGPTPMTGKNGISNSTFVDGHAKAVRFADMETDPPNYLHWQPYF